MNRQFLIVGAIVSLGVIPLLSQGNLQQGGPAQGNAQGQRGANAAVAVQRPGSIRGVVLRDGTNEPLADVQITAGSTGTNPPTLLLAITDSGGHFILNNVPAGMRNVSAQLEGYWGPETNGNRPGNSSKTVLVTSDMITDITIPMTPSGIISGRVMDPRGILISDIQVGAFLIAYNEGVVTLQQRASRTTDDRGEYRLFKLPPGTYYVAAVPRQNGNRPALPDNPVQVAPIRTYYLNVPDPAASSPLTVQGGAELSGIDIRLTTAVIGKISGQVVNTIPPEESVTRGGARGNRGGRGNNQAPARGVAPNAARGGQANLPLNATVNLFLHDFYSPQDVGFGSQSAAMDSPNNGHFEFRNVVPGIYDLYASLPDIEGYGPQAPAGQATSPMAFGRTTIEVRGGDVDGVTVTVHHGVTLKGRLIVDGLPANAPDNVRITLQPADSSIRISEYGQVSRYQLTIAADGSFTIPAVPEAHYRVQVQVAGGAGNRGGNRGGRGANPDAADPPPPAGPPVKGNAYVADVLLGGASIYDKGLDIGLNAPAQLEVILKTDPGSVTGTLMAANQTPVQGTLVVLVPAPQHRQNMALYKIAASNAMGRFTMNGVAPGDYKLFAWESAPNGAYQNAEFIRKYEDRGVPITVLPNAPTDTQIPLIPKN
jgi:uncharacterized protein (DUF2141 family)